MSDRGLHDLAPIQSIAKVYDLDARAFIQTVKAVAMPSNIGNEEFLACCMVAKEHQLNPLTKEIYFMKTRGGSIQPIVSVDGWIRKCNEHPEFDGLEVTDVRDSDGNVIAMTCSIWRKDRSRPTVVTEYLAECKANGGDVWNKSPMRMLRNRVICQCSRVAFGFAGIMEPDEFESWNGGMKDVTPSVPDILDIPDGIPDIPDADAGDETIADVDGFLKHLEDEIATAKSEGVDVSEIADANAFLIERLPEDAKGKAERLLEQAA